MQVGTPLHTRGFTIGTAANGIKARRAVVRSGTAGEGEMIVTAGANAANVIGFYDAPVDAKQGDTINITIAGSVYAEAGAAIQMGDRLKTAADGQLEVAADGENYIGFALESASAAGEGVLVYLDRGKL